MDVAGKSFVVTGGAGFVGSHVVDELVARGAARVTIIDNLSTGFREFIPCHGAVRLVEGDLLDQALLDRTIGGHDMVLHFAANADVKDGFRHPRRDVEQTILGTQNVLEAMRAGDVTRIALASTGAAYGEPDVVPTPESAPFPIQTSLYGASKVAAEGLLTAYAWGYGFEVWIFRFVSLLGPRYSHGHVFDFWQSLRRDPTRLRVLGDGHQRKSYLHVRDAVEAIVLAIGARQCSKIQIYNVGHHEWIEVNESVRIICETLGVQPTLEHSGGIRGWVGDSPRILLDTTRIRSLGWQPRRAVEACIQETLRFLQSHPYVGQRRSGHPPNTSRAT